MDKMIKTVKEKSKRSMIDGKYFRHAGKSRNLATIFGSDRILEEDLDLRRRLGGYCGGLRADLSLEGG